MEATAARVALYRAKTMFGALRSLYSLRQDEIDAFLDSYVLFDGDWSNANGKREGQIVDYYRVLNHLCALGNVEKMYIPPVLDEGAGVFANQILFEEKICHDLRIEPGDRVLDIGCGRGRVACHIAQHAGASVTGLNIDPTQIENARSFAHASGLDDRCRFRQGSLNDPLPFADCYFDGCYQIQAFTYARDREKVFAEIHRVLRPGATFSFLDWVLLPSFEADNPEHEKLVNRTRAVIGGVDVPSPRDVCTALERVGFEVVFHGDLSSSGRQGPLIASEDRYFTMADRVIDAMVKLHAFPPHFRVLFDRFTKDADAFLEADRLGLVTTSYQVLARKRPAPVSRQVRSM